nr:alpha/beta hydrolase [Nocardioides perillae]
MAGLPAWRARVAGLDADLARHRDAVGRWRAACLDADRALVAAAAGSVRSAGPRPTRQQGPALGREDVPDGWSSTTAPSTAPPSVPPSAPPADAAGPAAAAAWWAALPDPVRWTLVATLPLVVGRLDGLPPAVRDRANRLALARDLVTLTAREGAGVLAAGDRRRLALAGAAAEALRAATRHRDPRTGTAVPALLWDWVPRAHGGDGTAVLALGDPAAARRVAVVVPGLGTEGTDLPARARDAWHLWAAARRASADSVATVAWLGYDAPDRWGSGDLDGWRVAGQGLARTGGDALAADLAGLAAARTTDPHLVVVGHSYGAVALAHGAAGPGLAADDLVLLGAPGAGPAQDARDLGPAPVWVGSASSDPVTLLGDEGRLGGPGTLGRDPAGEDFGARRFAAEHRDRDVGLRWSLDQHRGYLTPGGESLAGLALVVAGRDEEVAHAEPRRDPWWRTPVDPEADRPVRARP